jgi:predicted aldo/keto reductase-like oxidoreductase
MEYRDFGIGNISLLGFGLMRLPVKSGYADIDKNIALEMVDVAIKSGINYFDTAWMYHEGESEIFAGEALSHYKRSSYFLASKMPLMFLKDKSDVDKIFAEQLKKCKTDYFDFYLLHGIQRSFVKLTKDLGVYENLLKKKEAGLIKQLGFSIHDRPELLKQTVDEHQYDFAQIQLNYVDWELQDSKIQYQILADKKIPVIIMEPVRGGSLAKLCDEAIKIFKDADPEASPASWALRFTATLPQVQVVLSGMSTMEQLKDNIKTFSPLKPITEDEQKVIDNALTAYNKSSFVPCTACRYCMDCPEGVEIPKNLAIYNNYERMLEEKHPMAALIFKTEYGLLKEKEQSLACISCEECVKHCPQHIDIPHWMDETTKKIKAIGS